MSDLARYVAYADEAWTNDDSLRHKRFYGGAILRERDVTYVNSVLNATKNDCGLVGEVKWTKTKAPNHDRVIRLLNHFFDLIDQDLIRLRWMWSDELFQGTSHPPDNLEGLGYFVRYYYFLVFSFGLPYHDLAQTVEIRFFLDDLPHNAEKCAKFKRFLMTCHTASRFQNQSTFRIVDVGEVSSREHVVLQCVDVIIGAIGFRLNKYHKKLQPNGKRAAGTVAKEKVYKAIFERLRAIDQKHRNKASFSVGINTSTDGDYANRWRHRVRQWSFRSTISTSRSV